MNYITDDDLHYELECRDADARYARAVAKEKAEKLAKVKAEEERVAALSAQERQAEEIAKLVDARVGEFKKEVWKEIGKMDRQLKGVVDYLENRPN